MEKNGYGYDEPDWDSRLGVCDSCEALDDINLLLDPIARRAYTNLQIESLIARAEKPCKCTFEQGMNAAIEWK